MPSIEQVIKDPDFHQLPTPEKRKVMQEVDPDFKGLPKEEQIRALRQMEKAGPPSQEAEPSITDDMSGLQRVLAGMGKGFVDIGQGAKQIGLQAGEATGLVPEGSYDEYTEKIAEEERLYDQPLLDTTGGKVGRFAGQMAATAPIPGGAATKLGSRMLTGAAAGGAAAGLTPTKPGESRAANIGVGAAAGGAGAGVLGAAGKAYRGIRGNTGAKASKELGDVSREFDVPLTVGELRNSPALQRIETLLERVPGVGTRGFREKQASDLGTAAKALAMRYSDNFDDVGEELQGSLSRSLAKNKKQAGELYDVVAQEAAKVDAPVKPNAVRAAARGILKAEKEIPEGVQSKNILKDVQRFAELEDMDFETARRLRSRLGQELRKTEKQTISGARTDEEAAALSRIKSALEDDIQGFAEEQGGGLNRAFRGANEFYRENVVPFKDRQIRKVGAEDFETDRIAQTFIKNNRPGLAAKLMRNLDPKGRKAVKYAILEDAFENASDGKTPFSPAKFAGRLERLGKTKNAIFTEAEQNQLEGFTKLARAAERAGQYAENPPTGQRAVDLAIGLGAGAGAVFEPITVFGVGTAATTLSKLLTSDAGRRLLTRASRVPLKNQNAMSKLLSNQLPKALAIATEDTNEGNDNRNR